MKNLRMLALLGASVFVLAACGDSTSDTGTTPVAAAPTSAAPATSAAAEPTPAAAGGDDKAVCETVNEGGEAMKKEFVTFITSGDSDVAPIKKALNTFAAEVATAASGSSSAVGAAANKLAEAAAFGADSADPFSAMESGDYEKAFKELQAACKPAGVTLVD